MPDAVRPEHIQRKPEGVWQAALMLATLCAPVAAQAQDVTWISIEVPGLIGGASAATTSGAASLSDYLIEHWPGASHRVVNANPKRAWSMIESGERACSLYSLHSPDREAAAYFYDTHLLPPAQLVVRREVVARLVRNAAGEVDLPRTLARGDLRGVLVSGRSYGPVLDDLFNPPRWPQVTRVTRSDLGSRLVRMLAADRADFTIEYDFAIQAERQSGAELPDVQLLPIQGASAPLTSGIACPRNEWGLATVRKAASILATPKAVARLRASYSTLLSPDTLANFSRQLDKFYADMLTAPKP